MGLLLGDAGQDVKLIRNALEENWQTRVNPLNPAGGAGPGAPALAGIMKLWSVIMPDVYIKRLQASHAHKAQQVPFQNFQKRGKTVCLAFSLASNLFFSFFLP